MSYAHIPFLSVCFFLAATANILVEGSSAHQGFAATCLCSTTWLCVSSVHYRLHSLFDSEHWGVVVNNLQCPSAFNFVPQLFCVIGMFNWWSFLRPHCTCKMMSPTRQKFIGWHLSLSSNTLHHMFSFFSNWSSSNVFFASSCTAINQAKSIFPGSTEGNELSLFP